MRFFALLTALLLTLQIARSQDAPEFNVVNGSVALHLPLNRTFYIKRDTDEPVDVIDSFHTLVDLVSAHMETRTELGGQISRLESDLEQAQQSQTSLAAQMTSVAASLDTSLRGYIDEGVISAATSLESVIESQAQELSLESTSNVNSLRSDLSHTTSMVVAVMSTLTSQASVISALSAELTAFPDVFAPRITSLEIAFASATTTLSKMVSCSHHEQFLLNDGSCGNSHAIIGVCPTPNAPEGVLVQIPTTVQPDVIEYLPGTTIVFSCDSGYFFAGDRTATCLRTLQWSRDAPMCEMWATCEAGTYVTTAPTASTNRLCEACGTDEFSTTSNAASCTAVRTCDANTYVSAASTASSDRVCATCPTGQAQPDNGYTGTSCFAYGTIPITSCSASSEYDGNYACRFAYNGVWADGGGNAWATRGQGVGSWIVLRFSQPRRVNRFVYQQRSCACEWFRQLRLDFSDGSSRTLDLPNNQGPVTLTFAYSTPTTYVRVYATAVYSTTNNGFNELQFYGV
eukprot:m.179182 g.179182  ORF g.179182 m.179182 type:complete len:515 (+) comp16599_c11_seq1:97-1641(+)